ncbi:MAG: cyclic nucleotide-binding domain-containing protein [Raineya sp.]|jgi:ATP/ADP translocase/HEAT repeat protein|nr:cyclic nucleotide-binding domain-containing protein [Raineya sp.]
MKKFLLKLLNIEKSEYTQVMTLLSLGFLIGVFLATYSVATTTLFLKEWDEDKYLPIVTIATGLVGIITTYIFSYLQNKISYATLSITTLIIVVALVGGLRGGFAVIDDPAIKKQLVFGGLVMLAPFEALVSLVFWGTIARMFTLKQQRRIVGGVDIGKGLAALATFFAIPIFSELVPATEDLTDITFVVGILILIVYFALVLISPLISFGKRQIIEGQTGRFGIRKMFKNQYIVLMAFFLVLATISHKFVDYTFLNATGQQYPDEKDLQNFIAVFEGVVIFFMLAIQIFAVDKIIEMYGTRVALLINPIVLGGLTTVAILVGVFSGFKPTADGGGGFVLFFLSIALGKLFSASLKESMDDAAFKQYYFPIDSRVRLDVISRMDGIVKVGAGLIAGLLLLGIQYTGFTNLLLFSIILIPIVLGWAFNTNKMYIGYKDTLKQTLVESKNKISQSAFTEQSLDKMLRKEAYSAHEDRTIFALKLLEKLEPSIYEEELIRIASNTEGNAQIYALKQIDKLMITSDGLISPEQQNQVGSDLYKLVKSKNTQDRLLAVKRFPHLANEQNEFLLMELLRDIDMRVRLYAVHACRKIRKPETWSILIDLLNSPVYANAAAAALIQAGDTALPSLESAFHKSGQHEEVMRRIAEIYGRIGTEKSLELLWNKINFPDTEIVEQVLYAFSYNNIRVPAERATLINHIIEVEIGDAAWDMAALLEISKDRHTFYLRKSLEDEIDYNFEGIFTLLSLVYDPQSVQLVKQNLESESAEAHVFAIELLNVFLADELKPKLFPLLEDLSPEEKIERLQEFFPRERFNSVEVLKHLISRDYSYTNRWTRACAIYALGFEENLNSYDELVANLFHPDPLLHETSAWAIYKHKPEIYEKMQERLPIENVKNIEVVIDKTFNTKKDFLMPLRIEKTMFLKDIDFMQNVPSDIVSEIVELIEEKHYSQTTTIIQEGQDSNQIPICIVAQGRVDSIKNGIVVDAYNTREIFGHLYLGDEDYMTQTLIAQEGTTVYEIDKDLFYAMVQKNHEFARAFIDAVAQDLTPASIKNK